MSHQNLLVQYLPFLARKFKYVFEKNKYYFWRENSNEIFLEIKNVQKYLNFRAKIQTSGSIFLAIFGKKFQTFEKNN